jgi:hypothetical protein
MAAQMIGSVGVKHAAIAREEIKSRRGNKVCMTAIIKYRSI